MALTDYVVTLAPKGTTGNGRFYSPGFSDAEKIAVEFVSEAIGVTPTVTFTIQGLLMGGDPTTSTDWVDLEYVEADSAIVVAKSGITVTTVRRVLRFLDGLDKRMFDYIAVNVTANTNVTFRANAYKRERF